MTTNKVWRNVILGNEQTGFIAVDKLPESEYQIAEKVNQLRESILAAEKIVEKAKAEITQIRDNCQHHYFFDVSGMPYEIRYCAVCGTFMGYI